MLRDLNEYIVCSVCNGYIVDATTVTECLHSCELFRNRMFDTFTGLFNKMTYINHDFFLYWGSAKGSNIFVR